MLSRDCALVEGEQVCPGRRERAGRMNAVEPSPSTTVVAHRESGGSDGVTPPAWQHRRLSVRWERGSADRRVLRRRTRRTPRARRSPGTPRSARRVARRDPGRGPRRRGADGRTSARHRRGAGTGPRPATGRADPGVLRGGRREHRRRHLCGAGFVGHGPSCGGRAAGRGRRPRVGTVRRRLRRESPTRATTPSSTSRWASACSTTSPSRRAS